MLSGTMGNPANPHVQVGHASSQGPWLFRHWRGTSSAKRAGAVPVTEVLLGTDSDRIKHK